MGIGLVVFVVYISFKLYDISMRDDHMFDEYDSSKWSVHPKEKYVWRKLSGIDEIPDDKKTCDAKWQKTLTKL